MPEDSLLKFNAADRALLKIDKVFCYFENTFCISIFCIMVLTVLYNVTMRYVFKHPNAWGEELARYTFILLTYFGNIICVREYSHVGVEVLSDRLKGVPKFVDQLIIDFLSICGYTVLSYILFLYTKTAILSNQVTPAMRIPFPIIYGLICCAFVLCVIRALMMIWDRYISKTHPITWRKEQEKKKGKVEEAPVQ